MKTLAPRCPFLPGALLVWLAMASPVCAGDLTTLSGTTYHQVRAVRVEPDGVVWEHSTGLCKVDFTDSPEAVRKAYHYDVKKAASYQAAQAQSRQQAAAQTQQNQSEAAAWRARQFQAQTAATATDAQSGRFVYRRQTAEAEKSVGEQITAEKAERDVLTKDDGTLWDRRLWSIPCLIVGGGYSPGVAFDPSTDLNAHEYQASLHHAPGGFATDSMHEGFFKPDYQTKAYYQEVERAEAFARGHP